MKSLGLFVNGHYVQTPSHYPQNSPIGPLNEPPLDRLRAPLGETLMLGILKDGEAESDEIIDAALQGAHETFEQIQSGFFPLHERLAFLRRLRNKIAEQSENLAQIMLREIAKPLSLCRLEVARGLATLDDTIRVTEDFFASQGLALNAAKSFEHFSGYITREARGPILAITPFNFPLNLSLHKIAPALAAGCPVVWKPSPKSQLLSLTLSDYCHACELPAGMLNLIQADNALTQKMAHDERITQISFTGSASVGWNLASSVTKPVFLELGGNAPVFVDASASLSQAAKKIVKGAFAYAGQVCISVQNIDVHEKVYEEFSNILKVEVSNFVWGNPLDESVLAGPVIDSSTAARLQKARAQLIQSGAQSFAKCGAPLLGNLMPHALEGDESTYLVPEIFSKVPRDSFFYREEIFGPFASLNCVRDFDEWKALVNTQAFRLQTGVFAQTGEIRRRAAHELRFGGVIINEAPSTRFDPMPYGGRGQSGRGREGARFTLGEYTEYKTVLENIE